MKQLKRKTRKVLQWLAGGLSIAALVCSLLVTLQKSIASAPYAASDILGQSDVNGTTLFNTDKANNIDRPNATGFATVNDVQIDTARHRLYTLESTNSRIKIFALDSNNHIASRTPIALIGAASYTAPGAGTSQTQLSTPYAMALDAASQRLFVVDRLNVRVLVFDVSADVPDSTAEFVIGQPDFTSKATASTQSGMRDPIAVTFDSVHQRLFVGDFLNGRVLVYDAANLSNGMPASYVIGKTDFTAWGCGTPTASNLCQIAGLAYDTAGQRLFVADYNRVLQFDTNTITNGMAAVHVVGQPNFTSFASATTQSQVSGANRLLFDSANNRLFVADGRRIVFFNTNGIVDGENASAVLGQTDFTSTDSTNPAARNHFVAFGMAYDPTSNQLFVADLANCRFDVFDITTMTNGENAVDNLGQTNFDGSTRWGSFYSDNNYPNPNGLHEPSGITMDKTLHRLFVSDYYNNRILVYNLTSNNVLADKTPDYVIGQADMYSVTYNTSQTQFGPVALAFDQSRHWLFVVDTISRVLIFDVSNITPNLPALYVIGQPDFTSTAAGLSDTQFGRVEAIAYDSNHKRLFVDDRSYNRVLAFDVTSPHNGMAASYVIGQANFTSSSYASDTGGLFWPEGVAYDTVRNQLFVADSWDDRIMVFDGNNLSNGMDASHVLGEPDLSTYDSQPLRNGTPHPEYLFVDSEAGKLYAPDWSPRVAIFDITNITDGEDAVATLGQADLNDDALSGAGRGTLSNPNAVYADSASGSIYVADDWDNRVLVYSYATITTPSLPNGTTGQAYNTSVTADSTQGAISYQLIGGSLPAGLSLSSNGTISGTPQGSGVFTADIQVTDDNGTIGTFTNHKQFTLTVSDPTAQAQSLPQQTATTSKTTTTATQAVTSSTTTQQTVPVLNNDTSFATATGVSQQMATGDIVAFTLAPTTSETPSSTAEQHHATIDTIGSDYVDLTIQSSPVHVHLTLNGSTRVNVDGQGQDDLEVTLTSIVNHKATILFRLLPSAEATAAPIVATKQTPTASSPTTTKRSNSVAIVAISALALLIAATIFIVLRARKAAKQSSTIHY